MLQLKHHFQLPRITFEGHPPLQLAPIPLDDGDELIGAIASDPIDHDNNWALEERPDQSELVSFWTQVTNDLKHDPDWADFGEDATS